MILSQFYMSVWTYYGVSYIVKGKKLSKFANVGISSTNDVNDGFSCISDGISGIRSVSSITDDSFCINIGVSDAVKGLSDGVSIDVSDDVRNGINDMALVVIMKTLVALVVLVMMFEVLVLSVITIISLLWEQFIPLLFEWFLVISMYSPLKDYLK